MKNIKYKMKNIKYKMCKIWPTILTFSIYIYFECLYIYISYVTRNNEEFKEDTKHTSIPIPTSISMPISMPITSAEIRSRKNDILNNEEDTFVLL